MRSAVSDSTWPVWPPFAWPSMAMATPCWFSKFASVLMSTRCGRFDKVKVSSVSRLAGISGNAAFLAPLTVIFPRSGRPPRMRILSMLSLALTAPCHKLAPQAAAPSAPGPRDYRERPPKSSMAGPVSIEIILQLRQGNPLLPLIFALAVAIRDLARLVGLEEQELAGALVGVDARGQRRGVGELERHVPLPFGLERGHVDDDATARIGRLAEADHQDVARHAEIFDGAREA